tara:strand:- start:157 stop:465 length:309 start_codon:yes stop_codon:yes gene_type:complete
LELELELEIELELELEIEIELEMELEIELEMEDNGQWTMDSTIGDLRRISISRLVMGGGRGAPCRVEGGSGGMTGAPRSGGENDMLRLCWKSVRIKYIRTNR